jgi:hypothetical protein
MGYKRKGQPEIIDAETLKKFLSNEISLRKFAKMMVREAVGGVERMNGNGKTYITAPSIEYTKLCLQYIVGMPAQSSEITLDNKDAGRKLVEIIQKDMRQRGIASVKADGTVQNLDTNQYTDTENSAKPN